MRQLLQELQNLGWWGRIFGWGRIRRMLLEASSELEATQASTAQNNQALQALQGELLQSRQQSGMAEARAGDLQRDKDLLNADLMSARRDVQRLGSELAALTQVDNQRRVELQTNLTSLSQLKERIAEERLQEHQARQEEFERKQQRLRQTWQTHQENARNKIRQIAEKHSVPVVDKFPLKGEPDNVLLICEQYVVLDAKSPGGEDLANFGTYLKTQAEAAVKYTKQEGVFGQLYFVVPSNTLESLPQTVCRFIEYTVYVIPVEALEPVNMLALEELAQLEQRLDELEQRLDVLNKEREELLLRIETVATLRQEAFMEAFTAVDGHFRTIFAGLSDGEGHLQLENAESPLDGGLTLVAHPKGKAVRRLAAMSGGEKSLTALSFLFALQRFRPSPFYALDEVDSFLDGVNVERLAALIASQADEAQFLVVSHRRPMIAASSRTIGVTQARGAHTQVVGLPPAA